MSKSAFRQEVHQHIEQRHQLQLRQQELQFEKRFDALIAQGHQERAVASATYEQIRTTYEQMKATYEQTKAAYERAVQVCAQLRATLAVKQEVIALLLPFYPHPISPELRRKIELS